MLAKSQPLTQLSLIFGGYSDQGKKAVNQDAFASLMPSNYELMSKGAVAVVADGVSSASMAKEASQLAVTQFINDFYATPDTWTTKKAVSKVLYSLNQWLYAQTDPNTGCALQWLTTFSAIVVKSATGYIFHVGDSCISLLREQQFETLTNAHQSKQGKSHYVLTRALGADQRLQVDMRQIAVQAGDIFMLTSDGVHDFLSTKTIKTQLALLPDNPSKEALEQVSRTLCKLAVTQGSEDNVSCLLVYVQSTPNLAFGEIEQALIHKTIPPALKIGQKIEGYEVIKHLHASSRSHLYLVKKIANKQYYVLKAPSLNFADDPQHLQHFIQEAWLGSRLKNSHVLKIQPINNKSQFLYHIGEYIEGQTLSAWMFDNPRPSIAQVRDIVSQIISALRAFQRLDVVHRDLKPDNIMIDSVGKITLIDYGSAYIASLAEHQHLYEESVPQGSLNYIAPETLLTLHADHQSDLFSLAVIIYEMLCGKLPYKPMRNTRLAYKHYQQWQYRSIKSYRDDLPIWLDMVLEKATQADPNLRYQAFSELASALHKPDDSAMYAYKKQPLMQRNPIKFWQTVSLIQFVLLLILLFF